MLFGSDKQHPTEYNGGHTSQAISKFMIDQMQNIVNERMGGGSSSSGGKTSSSDSSGTGGQCGGASSGSQCGGGSNNSQGGSQCGGGSSNQNSSNSNSNNSGSGKGSEKCGTCYGGSSTSDEELKKYSDKDVIVLDDSNFDEKLMLSQDMWMVEFYAPWCGHCKNLEPHWNKLATEMKGKKIRIAKYDADKNKTAASRFKVSGFPTLFFFQPGLKTEQSAENYEVS